MDLHLFGISFIGVTAPLPFKERKYYFILFYSAKVARLHNIDLMNAGSYLNIAGWFSWEDKHLYTKTMY